MKLKNILSENLAIQNLIFRLKYCVKKVIIV